MSKNSLGIEQQKLYTSVVTSDRRWRVRCFDGENFITKPAIYDSSEDAANAARLLTARDMERYKANLASRKFARV